MHALPALDSAPPVIDAELLKRYDRAGPRYTSYPAAPQFTTGFGVAQLREQAARSNQRPGPRPLSLYVHVPFCFSPCFYCGCNRIITRDLARGDLRACAYWTLIAVGLVASILVFGT